jgi:hypothetical protein
VASCENSSETGFGHSGLAEWSIFKHEQLIYYQYRGLCSSKILLPPLPTSTAPSQAVPMALKRALRALGRTLENHNVSAGAMQSVYPFDGKVVMCARSGELKFAAAS